MISTRTFFISILTCFIGLVAHAQISFDVETLDGLPLDRPTSLDFGPDDKLYVSQQDGLIYQCVVERSELGDYSVTSASSIDLVQDIPNHDDDGTPNPSVNIRQVTAILAAGTSSNPVLYVGSSDPRIGGGDNNTNVGVETGDKDANLDTNSGIVSRLTWNGSAWEKMDLVRGLPRSEENHSINGMSIDTVSNDLLLCVGGMTNAGSPSNNFAYATEYALSAAIVRIDLDAINAMPVLGTAPNEYIYDLPTLDDPTRAGTPDSNDPFGGNDGLNQAKIDPIGPVQIYAPGFRNVYDVVIAESGRVYTWDNGANQGWGGHPVNEGAFDLGSGLETTVTNNYDSNESGSNGPGPNDAIVNNLDGLHLIGEIGTYVNNTYYGGHPNPVRANPDGAGLYTWEGTSGYFRTSTSTGDPSTTLPADWPPVPLANANPIEGDFQNPTVDDPSLFAFESSTNGLVEYTASNFGGEMQGDLLAASFDDNVYRVKINAAGGIDSSSDVTVFASGSNFSIPLDVIAQGDNEIFPGTVWVTYYGNNSISILEPVDFFDCEGTDDPGIDEDGDGFMNADEIDAGTSPCNAANFPSDADGDFVSDLNDTDDDNDGIPDTNDYFPLDPDNGLSTTIPIEYELLNGEPGFGFYGLGVTGLMHDGVSDYADLLLEESNSDVEIIAGGAVGLLTINRVTSGNALGAQNDQANGFQFGVNVMESTPSFTISARTLKPYFTNLPSDASMGIFIGNGSQSDYIKIVIEANNGAPGISVVTEVADSPTSNFYTAPGIPSADAISLRFVVDPSAGTVQASYAVDSSNFTDLGSPILASGSLLQSLQSTPALAVGFIATNADSLNEFSATWEDIYIWYDDVACNGVWDQLGDDPSHFDARHEATYVAVGEKLYLVGGRGQRALDIYDPVADTWTTGATPPIEFHHFQAVELDGELWVAGAFIGDYPNETPVAEIHIYDPDTNAWRIGPTNPRPRGSAGVAVHNGILYIAGGLTNGHIDGHVPYLDSYNPNTDTWSTLANVPQNRDHFQMQVIDGKIWLAGGRETAKNSTAGVFGNLVEAVAYYDIASNAWTTLPLSANIPTPRAGTAAAVMGNELVIVGGESAQAAAHDEVEALDTLLQTWRNLPSMIEGRHGSGLAELNGRYYIASGSGTQGGSDQSELDHHEVYLPCSIYEPEISADVALLDFDGQPGITSPAQSVTLTNSGLYPLTIGSVGTNIADYQVQPIPATTLQPGAQTTVSVNFTADAGATGDIEGELYIYSNAFNEPILTIELFGDVELKDPKINITAPADGTDYLAGDTIHLTGTATDFDILIDLTDRIDWSSNLDGALGSGAALSLSHLSIGTHTITAEVIDDMGVSNDTTIEITVKEDVVIAINSGGSAYTSADGTNYLADTYFSTPSSVYPTPESIELLGEVGPVTGTPDPAIYESERWLDTSIPENGTVLSYDIPLSNGDYTVILQYAEIFFTDIEERLINVEMEGALVLTNFDNFQAAGHDVAIDKVYDIAVTGDNLDIDFVKNRENPKINGIRIVEPYPLPYPTVITSPTHTASFPTGRQLAFRATGEGTAIWTSDVDGLLGSGTSLDFSGLSEGSHTITLEMTSTDPVIREVSIDLNIVEPYAYWRDQQNWGGGDDDTKTGDPDLDSIDNDLERAFGLNPLVADRSGLPFSTVEAIESVDYFTFTYRRNLDASDLGFWIDSSTTLLPLSWGAETLTPSNHELIDEDGSTQVLRFKHPVSDDDFRFFRLRME